YKPFPLIPWIIFFRSKNNTIFTKPRILMKLSFCVTVLKLFHFIASGIKHRCYSFIIINDFMISCGVIFRTRPPYFYHVLICFILEKGIWNSTAYVSLGFQEFMTHFC